LAERCGAAAVGLAATNLDHGRQQSLSLDTSALRDRTPDNEKETPLAFGSRASRIGRRRAVNHVQSVIVGVSRSHPDSLIATAIEIARRFDAELVCASVDEERYPIGPTSTGGVVSMSFNPDVTTITEELFSPQLRESLEKALTGSGVKWSMEALAGDPARALAHLADMRDAAMIIVGTRQDSMRGNLHEFFQGSVAVHLAHRQHRPVVVVPLTPVPFAEGSPWGGKSAEV
jgi:nucleotide-binding universal stress UspA family protein